MSIGLDLRTQHEGYLYPQSALLNIETQVAAAFGRPVNPGARFYKNIAVSSLAAHGSLPFQIYQLAEIRHSTIDFFVSRSTPEDITFSGRIQEIWHRLSTWIMDWNFALSMNGMHAASPDLEDRLSFTGAILYDEALLLLDSQTPGVDCRRIAIRFILNFDKVYQLARKDMETSIESAPLHLGFPFSWTHLHSIFRAGLVLLPTKDDVLPAIAHEKHAALSVALDLLLDLDCDDRKTLFKTLRAMN
jgi:hypothetical protein